MEKDIIDELIEMAEQLFCLGPEGDRIREEQAIRAVVGDGKFVDPRTLRCPHCKMLERLRKLKLEAERK